MCGRKPSDPHHLGFTQPRAPGRKVSDEFAVPLCRGHHRALHRSHDERAWWRQADIDPIKVARRLWKETHGIGRRRPQRPALRRPHGVATSPDQRTRTSAPPQRRKKNRADRIFLISRTSAAGSLLSDFVVPVRPKPACLRKQCDTRRVLRKELGCNARMVWAAADLAGPEQGGRNPPDRGERGDLLSVAPAHPSRAVN